MQKGACKFDVLLPAPFISCLVGGGQTLKEPCSNQRNQAMQSVCMHQIFNYNTSMQQSTCRGQDVVEAGQVYSALALAAVTHGSR